MRSSLAWYGLLIVPGAFFVIFYFYPLISILLASFRPDNEGVFSAQAFLEIATSPYYRAVIGFTAIQATISTALTVALAIAPAFFVSRYDFPGKSLLLSLATLPFVLPTVVVSAAFSALLGRTGILNSLLGSIFRIDSPIQLERTIWIILIAHVFYNLPLALRMIGSYWANQDLRLEEAARVLGARSWQIWWRIRIPLLRPILLSTSLLVFTFTFTSFGVIVILGGPRFATIEVEIFRQAVNYFNLNLSGAFSVIQLALMFAFMMAYTRVQAKTSLQERVRHSLKRVTTPPQQLLAALILTGMGLMLFLPLAALILRSFAAPDGGLNLRNYTLLNENTRASILYVAPLVAVRNSFIYAAGTTLIATLFGTMVSIAITSKSTFARWLDPIFMMPLATSAVTLGFGYIIALDEPPLNLRTSPVLVLVSHILIAMPFVIRNVVPEIRAIPKHVLEASQVLGASRWKTWLAIEFPLIRRGIAVGSVFAFTISMGEFGASLFIARPEMPTMPIAIYRLLSQPGLSNYGQGLALSVLLMAVCAIGFLLLDRIGAFGDSGGL